MALFIPYGIVQALYVAKILEQIFDLIYRSLSNVPYIACLLMLLVTLPLLLLIPTDFLLIFDRKTKHGAALRSVPDGFSHVNMHYTYANACRLYSCDYYLKTDIAQVSIEQSKKIMTVFTRGT